MALARVEAARMVGDVSIHPAEPDVLDETSAHVDPGWITLVWNDPVNLMSYVTFVFQTYFGFSRDKAELLMLDVHHKGRAVVAHGPREQMERHVAALHEYGLWATFQKDE